MKGGEYMPFEVIHGGRTELKAEAVVFETKYKPKSGFSKSLRKFFIGDETELRPGMARITASKSPLSQFEIEVSVPDWNVSGARDALAQCYANAISLAREFECRSIAFPLLGVRSGAPSDEARKIAERVIDIALLHDDIKITLSV